jgi:hypothetical protein
MIAATLKKYLKKVKEFSKENSAYEVASNLYIRGSENELFFSCSDADTGIQQIVPIVGTSIIGECCVNVFNFAKLIDSMKDEDDLEITINNDNIQVKQGRVKVKIANYPSTNFFNIPEQRDPYKSLDNEFLKFLKKVIQTDNDDTYPIMYNHGFLYYANPRAMIVVETDIFDTEFAINNSFLKKMLLDNFDEIKITQNQIYLKNNTCTIFLPLFNGAMLDLRGPLRMVKDTYTFTCKMGIDELNYYYKIIKSLSDFMQMYRIEFIFDQDKLKMTFLDSEFIIKDFDYEGPVIKYGIPLASFKQIIKEHFIGNVKYLNIKLQDKPSMFVVEGDNVRFIGGLYRDL